MLKKTLVSATLLCCATFAHAINWVQLTMPSAQMQIYADTDSVQLADGIARFWMRQVYVPPQKGDDGVGGTRYLREVMTRWTYKCAEEQAAYSTLTMSFTNGHIATLRNGEFSDVPPGSPVLILGTTACSAKGGKLPP
jgi:hypothetical protein